MRLHRMHFLATLAVAVGLFVPSAARADAPKVTPAPTAVRVPTTAPVAHAPAPEAHEAHANESSAVVAPTLFWKGSTTFFHGAPAAEPTRLPPGWFADARQRVTMARTLVKPAGTGDEVDARRVAHELARLPTPALTHVQGLNAGGAFKVVAVKTSVTDYFEHLKGVRPRGWPPGATWDKVPGLYSPSTHEVVVATREGRVPVTGQGHGSFNMTIHEAFHGVDKGGAGEHLSSQPAFRDAYRADAQKLSTYESQEGDAGPEEAFAETAARFYAKDPKLAVERPNLYRYFDALFGPPAGGPPPGTLPSEIKIGRQ